MIILDTNVVSELSKKVTSSAVVAWLDVQAPESLYLTSINAAELWAGVAVLPEGLRKRALEASLESVLNRLFAGRRIPFDDAAARAYADIMQRTQAAGTPVPLADGLIAAIAAARGFIVATRDEASFQAASIGVINPWLCLDS